MIRQWLALKNQVGCSKVKVILQGQRSKVIAVFLFWAVTCLPAVGAVPVFRLSFWWIIVYLTFLLPTWNFNKIWTSGQQNSQDSTVKHTLYSIINKSYTRLGSLVYWMVCKMLQKTCLMMGSTCCPLAFICDWTKSSGINSKIWY